MRSRGARQSILVAVLGIALKTLLSLLVYAMPALGFWVASSLAAHRGGATWLPLVVGLLAFPVAPLAWDAVSELRRKKRGDARQRILTFGDRRARSSRVRSASRPTCASASRIHSSGSRRSTTRP